ncbi:MAG: hypothetical protein ACTSRS_22050 [Candidatus Helarchaeota archaeon]
MGTKEDAKIIRKALKKLCPIFSVRMARGTAYGWIDVWCGDGWEFSKQEKEALETFGLNYGGNSAVISPESRQFWVRRAMQILEGKTDRKYLKELAEQVRREKEEARKRREEEIKRLKPKIYESQIKTIKSATAIIGANGFIILTPEQKRKEIEKILNQAIKEKAYRGP